MASELDTTAPLRRRRVTLKDVAKHADTSVMAVSRVARGTAGVRPDMRERIQAAMEELGYRPNAVARGLRGRSYTLGVILAGIRYVVFPDLLEVTSATGGAAGYETMIGTAPTGAAMLRVAQGMIDRGIDGIVLDAPQLSEPELVKLADEVAILVISRYVESANYDVVNSDNAAGMRMVVDHLVGLGHERIAHLARKLPVDPDAVRVETVRANAYRDAMRAHGLRPIIETVPSPDVHDNAYRGGLLLLDRARRPTAIAAGSDWAALGIMDAAAERGLRIPEDLSLTGFDNTETAALAPISLTSIDHSGTLLGETAGRLLVERIEGRREPVHALIPVSLTVRASTAQVSAPRR